MGNREQGCLIFPQKLVLPLPQPLDRMVRGEEFLILFITPPSLVGKGLGG